MLFSATPIEAPVTMTICPVGMPAGADPADHLWLAADALFIKKVPSPSEVFANQVGDNEWIVFALDEGQN